jgi:tight adherence protein B
MITNNDQLPFIFFVFLAALVTTISFAFLSSQKAMSKNRLTRAVRPGVGQLKATSDLPSIARARYSFLKNRKRHDGPTNFFSFFESIESLIYASGLKWRLSSFLVVVFILFVFLFLGLVFVAQAGILISVLCAAPGAFFVGVNFLARRRARQLHKFQEIFPEALDLIVRSVRAGLPVSESIKMIGSEVAEPVGEAFRDVAANLGIGMSLDESLALLQKRVPIAEVKFFTISLTIQQETGGNLAEILANLASTMRKRVQIGKKIRALSSEAKASAFIIGSLPFVVGLAIYALNRSYIEVLVIDETGRLFLFGALGSIGVGAVVMAKLIRFEI